MELQLHTVHPHEVERGDRFLGLRSPVDTMVFDGNTGRWRYMDHLGSVITTRRPWQSTQVLRGGLSTHDTPPRGIERRLVLIAGGAL
jgi:hypothetical protein